MPNLDMNERCPASGLTNRDCINSICDCFPTEEDRWGLHPEYFEVVGLKPDGLGLPYAPKSRQQEGRDTERTELRRMGARQHPMSGAGRIKEDGSTDSELIEVKDANKSFALSAAELMTSFRRAAQQGKEAVWVIHFSNGIRAEIRLSREKT